VPTARREDDRRLVNPADVSLFLHPVRAFVAREPVTAGPRTPVRELARQMAAAGVGSIVIVGEDGTPAGIVTDRDLRGKVVAEGREPVTTSAAAVMSSPLLTVDAGAYGFEALLEMTRRGIHHLAVVDSGRLLGVVSSNDFLRLQTTHPVAVAREIALASSVDDLARLGARVTALVRRLVEEGGTPYDVGRIVAELNDRIVQRMLELATGSAATLGPPPVPFCWLAFGSEARQEQTLRTDQDNGLAYADPSPTDAAAVHAYFARLADQVNRALVRIGFPECPARIMASNPEWCQPVSVWAQRFRHWMQESGPREVLQACIFFDLRPVGGDAPLGSSLRTVIQTEAPGSRRLLGLLARDVVDRPVSLTVFGNIRVARAEPHRDTVDLKGGGGLQLVGAGRVHALALGLEETNTVDRFRATAARGVYGQDQCREFTDAHQLLQRLRLAHQLARLERGEPADNRINPKRLSHADALLLRDALRTVGHVQADLRERYATDLLQ
jgi:CBS domain-containing protein